MSEDTNNMQNKRTYILTHSGRIPYSIGYMAQALHTLGIVDAQAYRDAFSISIYVNRLDKEDLTTDEMFEIIKNWYLDQGDLLIAGRIDYLKTKFKAFKPMIILLGGVTGIGKSTLAQLLGDAFGIHSILGTDLIREVLRVTISKDLLPTLHTSSYIAHLELDTSFLPAISKAILGFEEQARSVSVGIESAIEQAIQDNEIMILEGVHLVPGLLKSKIVENNTVLFILLSLTDEEVHRARLTSRETKLDSRSENYLYYIDNIRKIHEYLIEQATVYNIPIIDIERDSDALISIINMIWEWKLSQFNNNDN